MSLLFCFVLSGLHYRRIFFIGYWILSCQLLSLSTWMCSSIVPWFPLLFLMKSGVRFVAASLKVWLWLWQFYYNVLWCDFLCVSPSWRLFLLNLWLDVFYQFGKFVTIISSNFPFSHSLALHFWTPNIHILALFTMPICSAFLLQSRYLL